ncbi:MAG: hypothetical protein IJN82_07815, partial [Clostridia bacterium]|nr:hypothetical protein [Clostridia bacterium]
MKIKTRITSMLSVIVMLISMMSFFVLPISVANAESYAGDAAYATGLTDTTSFTAFSSTGAQKIIDLHYSELNEKNDVYRLATVAEAEAAAKDTRFTPTAHFPDYYQKPFTGYRWKMEAGNYKIESVEDMKLLAELSNCGVSFKGVVFYQAADLDFEWEPFRGICIGHSMIGRIMHNSTTKEIGGVSTSVFSEAIRTANAVRPFNGTYDGNGFIIENFYLVSNDAGNVGLFGWVYDGAVIKNVGIASGFIAGQECVGAIAGETNTSKFYNCWSAATVWGNGTNGVGGLIGRLTGSNTALHNCYNLGMVFQYDSFGAGLIGWQNNGSVKNSYNWGQVILAINSKNPQTHSVIMRKNTTHNPNGSKLYYRNDCINSGTSWAEAKKVNSSYESDNAVGVDATAANVAMLCGASYLNSGISSANASGWIVQYQDLGVGYPVLTYTKDGQTISRVARTDMIGENHWGAQDDCALMKLLYEINVEHVGVKGRLDHVKIHTANDLFILGLLTTFSKPNIASISIEADIDMDTEFTLLRGLKTYVPLYSGYSQGVNFSSSVYGCTPDIKVTEKGVSGSKAGIETSDGYALYCAGGLEVVAALNIPFDGKYHEVSNWNA